MAERRSIDRNDFLSFLQGSDTSIKGQVCQHQYEFIKLPCRPGVVGVYGRKLPLDTAEGLEWHSENQEPPLQYMGIYCSDSDEMFDCPDFFWQAFIINRVPLDSQRMLYATVLRRAVADHVLAHPEEFGADKITQEVLEGRNIGREADEKARLAYFAQKSLPEIDVPLNDIRPGLVIDFLNDKDTILQRELKLYLSQNTALLALNLEVLVRAQELIRLIKKEKNCGPKRRRRISRAVKGKELVCVSVEKEGYTLSFQMKADSLLLEYGSGYDYRYIADEFRRRYCALFGKVPFTENEIIQISHGRQVLYEREGPAEGGSYDKIRAKAMEE